VGAGSREGPHDRQSSCFEDLGQFERHMSIHVVMVAELWVGRVQVEASASAKVPIIIFTGDVSSSRRGVWEKDGDPLSGRWAEECAFLCSGQKG
jgi:hypothetical protein